MAIGPALFFLIPFTLLLIALGLFTIRSKVKHPTCPSCSYNITGLESNVCPECGADLTVIGILLPNEAKPHSRLRFGLGVTCIMLAAAILTTPIIVNSIPPAWMINGRIMLAGPESRAYSSVTITGAHTFRKAEDARAPILVLELHKNDKKSSTLVANFKTMACRFNDNAGETIESALQFSDAEPEATILKWFGSNGIAADGLVHREIREIAKALRDHHEITIPPARGTMRGDQVFIGTPGMSGSLSSGSSSNIGVFRNRSSTATSGGAPDPWPVRFVILGWLVLWALAMALVMTLVGRRMRQPSKAPRISLAPEIESQSA